MKSFRLQSLVNRYFSRSLSNMVNAKKFIYAKRFDGEPKVTDFELREEELPALKNGGKCVYLELCTDRPEECIYLHAIVI